ncbi:MAG TPA: hypothetical protein VMZ91_05790 [Candidatus Paceibacterota bacterium]|nr:hypothetical protein [Candidatus Paceibacterota bacterium]
MEGCTESIFTIEFNQTELDSLEKILDLIKSIEKSPELEKFHKDLKGLVKSLQDPLDT